MSNETKPNFLPHIDQIDLLKGFAICAVLLQHTISANNVATDLVTVNNYVSDTVGATTAIATGSIMAPSLQAFSAFLLTLIALTTRQAVPVFVVLLGVNSAISFIRRKYTSLNEGYSKEYFLRRIERLYFPFLIVLFVFIIIGIIETYLSNLNLNHLVNIFSLAGMIPVNAPGNYFIILVFQFTLIFPLLFFIYKKNPSIFILGCFLLGFMSPFLIDLSSYILPTSTYYPAIFKYLPGIALGVWIARDLDLFAKRNRFILLFTPIAIAVIILTVLSRYNTPLLSYNAVLTFLYPLVFFFPTFIVLMGIRYLQNISQFKLMRVFSFFGKASYHIFLIQMIYFNLFFYFGILGTLNPNGDFIINAIITIINVICCLAFGILFMKLSDNMGTQLKNMSNKIKITFTNKTL